MNGSTSMCKYLPIRVFIPGFRNNKHRKGTENSLLPERTSFPVQVFLSGFVCIRVLQQVKKIARATACSNAQTTGSCHFRIFLTTATSPHAGSGQVGLHTTCIYRRIYNTDLCLVARSNASSCSSSSSKAGNEPFLSSCERLPKNQTQLRYVFNLILNLESIVVPCFCPRAHFFTRPQRSSVSSQTMDALEEDWADSNSSRAIRMLKSHISCRNWFESLFSSARSKTFLVFFVRPPLLFLTADPLLPPL
mmetsp:Transcript_29337/g.62903  ORF Transcript_29337/g.62903 Transcript_29337/m.62903 type:complete len:249 (+) Transcript_29337:1315-2061(+)